YTNCRNDRVSLVNFSSLEETTQESRDFSHERFKGVNQLVVTRYFLTSNLFLNITKQQSS
ncbi:hypothetical protein, partial [Paenibacillus sp. N3.4]|uniref:hypothetical protein n=1 Tax=Paenibacillus sp. N3.4 TaxID=2603222 RepID=UPI001C9D00EB